MFRPNPNEETKPEIGKAFQELFESLNGDNVSDLILTIRGTHKRAEQEAGSCMELKRAIEDLVNLLPELERIDQLLNGPFTIIDNAVHSQPEFMGV